MEARFVGKHPRKYTSTVGVLLAALTLMMSLDSQAEPYNPVPAAVAGTEFDMDVSGLVAYHLESEGAPSELRGGQWVAITTAADNESFRQLYGIRRAWNPGTQISRYEVHGRVTISIAEQQIDHDAVAGDTRFLSGGGIQAQLREGARAVRLAAPEAPPPIHNSANSRETRRLRLERSATANTPTVTTSVSGGGGGGGAGGGGGGGFSSSSPPLPGFRSFP